jgi:hypothetical protein
MLSSAPSAPKVAHFTTLRRSALPGLRPIEFFISRSELKRDIFKINQRQVSTTSMEKISIDRKSYQIVPKNWEFSSQSKG